MTISNSLSINAQIALNNLPGFPEGFCLGDLVEILSPSLFDHKESVRAATTGVIVLSGEQTIDTVALLAGDRVLVKNQGDATNGIYIVSAAAWIRSIDADEDGDLTAGSLFVSEEGAVNGQTPFFVSNPDPIEIGVTVLTFATVSSTALTAALPEDVDSAAASAGVSGEAARADHKHDIGTNGVDNDKLVQMAANTIKSNATAGLADQSDLAVGANTVIGRVAGNIVAAEMVTAQVADDAITNDKAANMNQDLIKGRASGAGGGDPTDLTAAQVRTIINVADGANAYVHPNHSGDVTSVADGAQTIVNDAVTNAKAADMDQDLIKGRVSGAGTGDPTDLTATQVRTIINVADGANAYVHPNHSGDVTSVADGAQTIVNDAVTNAKAANMAANTVKANATGGATDPADLAVGANTVVGRVGGNIVAAEMVTAQVADDAISNAKAADMAANTVKANATAGATDPADLAVGTNTVIGRVGVNIVAAQLVAGQVADDAITNAKAANMAQDLIKGRVSGAGTGDPTDLTATQVRTIINVADGANAYVHPNHSGDVTSVADGAQTIVNDAVTNAKAANMAANTVKANATGGATDPADLAVGANTVVGRVAGNIVAAQLVAGQVANDAITNAKLANMAQVLIKGRASGAGTGDPTDLTATEVRTIINVADGANATEFFDENNILAVQVMS